MDVFAPEGPRNGLGVIDVIGGGWFSDRVQLNEHIGLGVIDVLCAHGYTVFAVCTGSVSRFTGIEMVRHVHEAVRHVKTLAEDFGVAPDRLALMGASAGGHVAALAALSPRPMRPASRDPFRQHNSSVAAVALLFAPTDLVDYGGTVFRFVEMEGAHLGGLLFDDGIEGHPGEELKARMAELSPARLRIQDPPPFLLIHGDADRLVPLGQSRKLAAALKRAGGDVELVVKAGAGHVWPDIRKDLEHVAEWFGKRLGMDGNTDDP